MPFLKGTVLSMLLVQAADARFALPSTSLQDVAKVHGSITVLSFKEFFESGTGSLKPTTRLLSLNGKRVRLVGFMAQMEQPPLGGFYLCPRPITCDEEGAGTADLPAESVLVIMRAQNGKVVSFRPGVLEATGILEVGNREDADGRVSFVRLVLDGPESGP